MKNLRSLTLVFIAFSFTALSLTALVPARASAQSSTLKKAIDRCEKRVKKINNRGKKMAKASKKLQTRYKKVNAGWKNKTKLNREFSVKYSTEARLGDHVNAHNQEINNFQNAVKAYNAAKGPYIAERNSQIKSYKKFKVDCKSAQGRSSAQNKIRALIRTDSKAVKDKAQAVSYAYKTSVRPAIVSMRNSRINLLLVKRTLDSIAVASPAQVAAAVPPDSYDIDEEVDEGFDQEELDDLSNVEEPTE